MGEVGDAQRGGEIQAAYTSGDDMLHMAYDFDLLSNEFPTGERVQAAIDKSVRLGPDSWPCWAYSNHDVVRHASRWNLSDPAQRVYMALLLSLRGTVCLYQGEELGLTEAYIAFEDLQDPYGKRFWPKFKGRDGCRTPMPWSSDLANGGFSDGKPWLPVAMEHIHSAVETQDADADSILIFYRRMIEFRRAHRSLLKGTQLPVESDRSYISFIREHDNARVFCAFNLSDEDRGVTMPDGSWRLDRAAPFRVEESGDAVTLPPWQALFAVVGD